MAANLPFDPLGIRLWLFIHLVLALFSNITGMYGYNIATWVIMLWAVYQKEEYEGLFITLSLIMFSGLLDIITLALYADGFSNGTSEYKFALAMNIIGLLLKPLPLFLVFKEFTARGGNLQSYLPFLKAQGGYETIDQPPNYQFGSSGAPAQQPPAQQQAGGYQQIPSGYPVNPAPGAAAQAPLLAPAKQPVDPNAAPF